MSSGLLEPPEGGEPLCVFLLRDRGDEEEEEEEEETSRDVGCQWESPEEDRREVGCQSDSAERRDAAVQVDLLTQQLSWRHTELPRHSLILDVRTRWNSLYLTLERFTEQYPVIQAASLDQRLRKNMERDRLARLTEEDFRRAEDFINLMKVLYASTLCVSSEKSPTCGQILPILQKLEAHLTVKEGDTVFVSNLKKQNDEIRSFLQVATALDPRFKHKLDDDTVWDQIQRKLIEQSTEEDCGADGDTMQSEKRPENEAEENEDEEESQPPPCKLSRKTPLEELFAEEEAQNIVSQQSSMSIKKRVERELQIYQEVPPAIMSEDPAAWWWNQRKTYPLLSDLAFSYLCIQASSTPSERVLHCRRHYLSRTVTHTA